MSRRWRWPARAGRRERESACNRQLFFQLLLVIEACIIAIEREQLVVPSELDDAPAIEYGNLIGIANSRDAVRDEDRGGGGGIGAQSAENALFSVCIHAGERIVEDKNRRAAQQCAGDGASLLLPAGERDAALADHGLKPLRKLLELLADVRGLGSLKHFGFAGAGRTKGEVFTKRLAEQERLLRHHADVAAQNGERIVAHGTAIDEEGAFGRFIEARNEAHHGGFSRACWPDDSETRSRGNVERDVAQHRSGPVAAAEVSEFDLSPHRGIQRKIRVSGAVVDGRLALQQLVDALDRCGAALEEIDDPSYRDDGPDEHDHVDVESDKLRRGDVVLDDQPAAEEQGDDHGDAEHKFKRGPQHAHELDERKGAPDVFAVEPLEEADL